MSSLTKSDIIKLICEKTGKSQSDVKQVFDATIDVIVEELVKGSDINLIGFASFKVKQVPERKGRNPATGQEITIAARKALSITPGKSVKDAINH